MVLSEKLNLGSIFEQHFEMVPAYSKDLKEESYRIRHQVYCEELKFEPIKSNRHETDKHDIHALHLLMRDIKTYEFIGCVRFIRPQPENPDNPLPFEEICSDTLDRSIIDPTKLPRHKLGEASRPAVIARYRRRKGEMNRAVNISNKDFGTPQQPRFPYIPIALCLGIFYLAHLSDVNNLFILTEERLANHFHKMGFKIKFVGSSVEHHGERFPSLIDLNATLNEIRSSLRPLSQTILADIKKQTLANSNDTNLLESILRD